jgi:hypothetical protein
MSIKLELDPEKLAILSACTQNYDVGSDHDEWPNNILSRFTQVYNDGMITKQPTRLNHIIDENELALSSFNTCLPIQFFRLQQLR